MIVKGTHIRGEHVDNDYLDLPPCVKCNGIPTFHIGVDTIKIRCTECGRTVEHAFMNERVTTEQLQKEWVK